MLASNGRIVGTANMGSIFSQWRASAIGDYNGDGHPDVVFRNTQTGENVVWFFSGIAFAGSAQLSSEPNLAWTIAGPR
jgi:hypothetical protein